MKNVKLKILFLFTAVVMSFTSCDDDDQNVITSNKGAAFERTASGFVEGNGDMTHQIAIKGYNGPASGIQFSFGGTATEGEDYEVVGFSEGMLTLTLKDDNLFEANESIKIRIASAVGGVGGNEYHIVSL